MPDYGREESRAHQLDRNWAELVQELRVIGTGIQILFAFLLSIAFQARFGATDTFQRDVYLATLLASGAGAALFIAPVALHRFLFQFRLKDEIVKLTNWLAIGGLASVAVATVGAILLVTDWVGGSVLGAASALVAAVVLGGGWFVAPLVLRHRARQDMDSGGNGLGPLGAPTPQPQSRLIGHRAVPGTIEAGRDPCG